MTTQIFNLENNIEVFCKINKNTPRIALCFNMKSNSLTTKAGVNSIMARLFLQGTKNRTAEELANELDEYAIEFSAEAKPDYIRFKFVCLNEDFSKSLEIMNDIIQNTTFDDFDKETGKMEGEIIADLDSPKSKVADKYYSEIFKGHPYGNTNSVILNNIKNITKSDVTENYKKLLETSKKVITVVGDIDVENVKQELNDKFSSLAPSVEIEKYSNIKPLDTSKYEEIIKPDANQAHIIKGWITQTISDDDYYPLLLLNVILGSSGLSSRLFLELRDKKGLAYVVRSCYETFAQGADFYIYIATEPKNIEVSLAGFKEEIDKICTIPVGREELENAKNNMLGKWAFTEETNENQAIIYANFGILGLGFDFREKAKKKIKEVTPEQILECAKKYFGNNSVLSVLKP